MIRTDRIEGLRRLTARVITGPTPAEAADRLTRSGLRPDELSWVLWTGASRPVTRAAQGAGLRIVARYGTMPGGDSPTHLVRIGGDPAARWFADAVRPSWGFRGRLARRLGRIPRLAEWTFPGRAVLVAGARAELDWPLSPGAGTPAVIALGGGATSGRCVLTFTDSGVPLRHVKIDPMDRPGPGRREAAALRALATMPGVAGSAPALLGEGSGPDWVGTAVSHVDGVSLERRWDRDTPAESWLRDVEDVLDWHASFAADAVVTGISPRPARLPLDDLPADLADAVRRGLRSAGSALPRLIHGDLWPANILWSPRRVAVIDWESARPGHPVLDALTFLGIAAQRAPSGPRLLHRGRSLSEAMVDVLTKPSRLGTIAATHLSRITSSDGIDRPSELSDLVLAQLALAAFEDGPGGISDAVRTRTWVAALIAVWQAWASNGGRWGRVPTTGIVGDAG